MKVIKLSAPKKQLGTALAVSLFLLTIVTFVGVSSMGQTVMLEKMAHNSYATEKAFQASEVSLRSSEEWLNSLATRPDAVDSCNTPPCDVVWDANMVGEYYGGGTYNDNWWTAANSVTNHTWWQTWARDLSSFALGGKNTIPVVNYVESQPKAIIEQVGFLPDDLDPNTAAKGVGTYYYRITTRGTGSEASNNDVSSNKVYLQSVYSKRFK